MPYVLKTANKKWPRVHLVSILGWTERTEWLLYVRRVREWKEQEEKQTNNNGALCDRIIRETV